MYNIAIQNYYRLYSIHSYYKCLVANWKQRAFPGGPGVENPPCNAGGLDSIPGQGTKIQYAAEQPSQHSATAEPEHHNQRICVLQWKIPMQPN